MLCLSFCDYFLILFQIDCLHIQLREEIGRCELLKLKNMKQVTDATRTELQQWWDRCYFSKDQRDKFTAFASGESLIDRVFQNIVTWMMVWGILFFMHWYNFILDDYTEDLLEAHDHEVSFVKQYFEENKDMLENVSRRQKLFDQFLEFEVS